MMKNQFFKVSLSRLVKRLRFVIIAGVVALGLTVFSVINAWGQSPIPNLNLEKAIPSLSSLTADRVATAEINLDGYNLFAIAAPALASNDAGADITPIRQRERGIENVLKRIVANKFDPEDLKVTTEVDGSSNLPVIYVNDQYLMTVTTLDAQLQVQRPDRWAEQLTSIIRDALLRAQRQRQPEYLARQSAIAAGVVLALVISSGLIIRTQRRLRIRRHRIVEEIEAASAIDTGKGDEEAQSSVTVTKLQLQHSNRRRHDLKDMQARLLRVGHALMWILGSVIVLGLFPYTRWLQPLVFATPLQILSIILGIYALIRVNDVLIERFAAALAKGKFLNPDGAQRIELRVGTFSRVLKSGAAVFWIVVGFLTCLSLIGVDLVPLVAGAGIIGLAISFAAQSLIKDMINGFLILFEDQFAVGDVIIVGQVSGFVENMNLRITQLRNNEGQLITIPNSAISIVQNLSKDWSRVDLAIELAYGTNPDHALEVIKNLADQMYNDPAWTSKMPEPPEVLGIDEVDHTGILIRIWLKTLPLQQWAVAREFRRRLTLTLEPAGLKVGIPQQSLYFRSALDLELEDIKGDRAHQLDSAE